MLRILSCGFSLAELGTLACTQLGLAEFSLPVLLGLSFLAPCAVLAVHAGNRLVQLGFEPSMSDGRERAAAR
ncbi:MAG: hypothetical protein KDA45_11895 [Planctomycetales bacterium]|nr:hypothetical protein [Planctomycetales bacterium]